MKNFKVSKKDVKLLLILLSLIILYLTYQFVYTKNLSQVDLLNMDISVLNTRLTELQIKVNQGDKIRKENETMLQEFESIVQSYGNGATEEKSIMMVKNLEDVADMSISTASFAKPIYFFNGSNTVDQEVDMSAVETVEAELATASGDITEAETVNTVQTEQLIALENMSGYMSSISITFSVSYEGFKQCVDYINHYYEKCNVGDVSLSYDMETGMLSGTMIINMYHLTGEDIEYQAPIITSMDMGTDNIFGTLEMPVMDEVQ